jgi:hypothetical protein
MFLLFAIALLSTLSNADVCPDLCKTCRAGGARDGGVDLINGVCTQYCSLPGHCGISDVYKNTDCQMCSEEVTKIGDFECADGNEIRMFDGKDDNVGNFDKKLENCKRACLDKKSPLSSSWALFGSKMPGFIMNLDGRCYCESSSSGNCERDTDGYSRWDFGSGVTNIGDFECTDGNEIRMFDGKDDNVGTFDQKLENCKRACLDKKSPLSSSWASFGSKMSGLIMTLDGRCLCESSSSGTCERENEYDYFRWDFGSACDCIGTPDWGNTCWPWQKDGTWCYLKGGLEARNCPGARLSSVAGAGIYWSEQPCAIKGKKLNDLLTNGFTFGPGRWDWKNIMDEALEEFDEEGQCVSGFSDRIDYVNYKLSRSTSKDYLHQDAYYGLVYEGQWVQFVENIDNIKVTVTEQKSTTAGHESESAFTSGWSDKASVTVTASVSAAFEGIGASMSVSGTTEHSKSQSATSSQTNSMSTTSTDTMARTTNCDTLFNPKDMDGRSSNFAFHIYRWHITLKKLIPTGCADHYCTINKLNPNQCIDDVFNGKSGCCDIKHLLKFTIIGKMKTCMFKKFWMPRKGKPQNLLSLCSKLKPNCFPFADCSDDACQTCTNIESRIEKFDAKTLHKARSCGDGHDPSEDQEEEEIAQLEELLGLLQELH